MGMSRFIAGADRHPVALLPERLYRGCRRGGFTHGFVRELFRYAQASHFPGLWLIAARPGAFRCALQLLLPSARQKDTGSPGSRARCLRAYSGSLTARDPPLGARGMAFSSRRGMWVSPFNTWPARPLANARPALAGLAEPLPGEPFIHDIVLVLTGTRR
jgi:hypothetical protein